MYWVFLLAALQTKEAVVVGGKAGLSLIESGILGSVVVIAILVAIGAIVMLIRVQNQRVQDQKAMSTRMEKLTEKMITTFSEMKNALENLTRAEKDGQTLLQAMKISQDTLILEAIRGSGSVPVRG